MECGWRSCAQHVDGHRCEIEFEVDLGVQALWKMAPLGATCNRCGRGAPYYNVGECLACGWQACAGHVSSHYCEIELEGMGPCAGCKGADSVSGRAGPAADKDVS